MAGGSARRRIEPEADDATIAVTAREVPEIRARMVRWTRDESPDGAANWYTFFFEPSLIFDPPDDGGASLFRAVAAQLPAAELFYVSHDMTTLAAQAAESLPDYRLHPQDLPAPVGLMVYVRPPAAGTDDDVLHDEGITILSWGPDDKPCSAASASTSCAASLGRRP